MKKKMDWKHLTDLPQVVNSLTYDHNNHKGVVFTMPSETVPDMALSMKEILSRFSSGLPVGGREEFWDEEEGEGQGIDPRTLDLVDIEEMTRQHKENEEMFERARKRQEEEKQRAKLKAEFEEEAKRRAEGDEH